MPQILVTSRTQERFMGLPSALTGKFRKDSIAGSDCHMYFSEFVVATIKNYSS